MIITGTSKLYAAAAIVAAALVISVSLWSHFWVSALEAAAAEARSAAASQSTRADRLEAETLIYKEKAAYLESQLSEIRDRATKQDEELKKLSADTDAARRALQRARGSANKN